jgi:hypothetical protein
LEMAFLPFFKFKNIFTDNKDTAAAGSAVAKANPATTK